MAPPDKTKNKSALRAEASKAVPDSRVQHAGGVRCRRHPRQLQASTAAAAARAGAGAAARAGHARHGALRAATD